MSKKPYANRKVWYRAYYDANKDAVKARCSEYRKRVKRAVMEMHGGVKCTCCGETRLEFLALNHIYGGGNRERKSLINGAGGYSTYLRLYKHPQPDKFNVLCHNCNCALGFYGYCPHAATDAE